MATKNITLLANSVPAGIIAIDDSFRNFQLFIETSSDYSNTSGTAHLVVEAALDSTFTGTWIAVYDSQGEGPNTANTLITTGNNQPIMPFVRARVIQPPDTGTWSFVKLFYE